MSKKIINFNIVKPPPLRQIVYEKLKEVILSDTIPKGVKIYESRLAEEMGVSRTPVREALHALEREMLISSIDKVGYIVNDVNPEDLEEISEIRKTVESLALKKAIKNVGKEHIEKLERNLSESERILNKGRSELFIHLDAEFHNVLCSMSQRDRLIQMAETLRKEMHRFRNRAKSIHPLAKESLEYHKKIVHFLKKKDYRRAKEMLNLHIDHVKSEISKSAPSSISIIVNINPSLPIMPL